jgi:hypothetical protein
VPDIADNANDFAAGVSCGVCLTALDYDLLTKDICAGKEAARE